MKKLNLDVESLQVDSFYATPVQPRQRRGTVHGQATTIQPVGDTQDTRCGDTAYYTCTLTGDVALCGPALTDVTCYGGNCYSESVGPAGSCSAGCPDVTSGC